MDPGLPASVLQSGSIRISLSLHAQVALCGCLHNCACACKPAPRIMQHPRFLFTSGVIRIPLSLHAHVALCGCLHYCACACKPAPRIMQHPRFLFTSGVIRIPLSLHAHVALSRYVDVCITALVRASPHRALCSIHAFYLRAVSFAFRCRSMLMSRCRAMWMFALLRLCVQARTAHYATSTHRS